MQSKTPGLSCFALLATWNSTDASDAPAGLSARRVSAGKTRHPQSASAGGTRDIVEIAAVSGKSLFNRLIRLVYNILRFSLDRHNRLTYLSDPMEM